MKGDPFAYEYLSYTLFTERLRFEIVGEPGSYSICSVSLCQEELIFVFEVFFWETVRTYQLIESESAL